jgi:hypothetical protein
MPTLCLRCRIALRHSTAAHHRGAALPPRRALSTTITTTSEQASDQAEARKDNDKINISALLHTPTWSVRSLLPPPLSPDQQQPPPTDTDTTTLSRLLRLSALPPPPAATTLAHAHAHALAAQLHFVRALRAVDTTGVAPLPALRDESAASRAELTIGLAALRDALAREAPVGRMRRPRRRRRGGEGVLDGGGDGDAETRRAEDWDVLGCAERTVGRYFVVGIARGGGGGGAGEGGQRGRSNV